MVVEGYIQTAEHKRNSSLSHKGRVITPEHRQKISEALKGRKKGITKRLVNR